jgi:hypothetical protein
MSVDDCGPRGASAVPALGALKSVFIARTKVARSLGRLFQARRLLCSVSASWIFRAHFSRSPKAVANSRNCMDMRYMRLELMAMRGSSAKSSLRFFLTNASAVVSAADSASEATLWPESL